VKVLIISDIHSNYEALLAVSHAEKVEEIWCLGDLVDFGPQPAETVQWIRHHVRYCVRGNHDNAMGYGVDCGCGSAFWELSWFSREMNRKLLSGDQIQYLRNLPRICDLEVDGTRIRLAHADPRGDFYRFDLTPQLSDAKLAEAIKDISAEFIFCGHTHIAMKRHVAGKTFVNPGSVGQPLDGNCRASYATWEDGKVKLHRVSYDVVKVSEKLHEHLPNSVIAGRLAEILRNGKSDPLVSLELQEK
jgi:putative phosphoesterase